MRRAVWLLSLAAGLAGLLLARRGTRPALPTAVTRALEPSAPKPRPRTPDAPNPAATPPPPSDVKRVRLPWADGHR